MHAATKHFFLSGLTRRSTAAGFAMHIHTQSGSCMRHQTYFLESFSCHSFYGDSIRRNGSVRQSIHIPLGTFYKDGRAGKQAIWASWDRSDNVLSSFINRSGGLMLKERWEGRRREERGGFWERDADLPRRSVYILT